MVNMYVLSPLTFVITLMKANKFDSTLILPKT